MEYSTVDIINRTCPVSAALVYPNGTVILRRCRTQAKWEHAARGKAGKMSRQSVANLVFLVTETSVTFVSMFTATYGHAFPTDGKTTQRHWNRFRGKLKYHFNEPSYLWFSEFQRRGALHFHVLLTIEPAAANRKTIAKLWCDSVGKYKSAEMIRVSSHRKAFELIHKKDNAMSYLTSYATKQQQKTIPKNFSDMGRWWGASRDVKDSIPEPLNIDCYDEDIRLWYPRLENAPLLPKIVFASRAND